MVVYIPESWGQGANPNSNSRPTSRESFNGLNWLEVINPTSGNNSFFAFCHKYQEIKVILVWISLMAPHWKFIIWSWVQ